MTLPEKPNSRLQKYRLTLAGRETSSRSWRRRKSEMSAWEGLETKRLDEIGSIFSGSTPSTSIHSFWDGEIVWVTPNDLSKLRTPYLCDSGKRITEKGLNSCSAQLLPAASLVMSSRAPIGYVALRARPTAGAGDLNHSDEKRLFRN